LYKYDGATFTLLATDVATPEGITQGTVIDAYFTALAVPPTTMALTDRLALRVFVTTSGRTLKLHTEDSHLSQVITTLSTGVNALNGLTAQVQNFAVGTAGADFGISSVGSTHTFNLPTASAANRGLLSTTDWLAFNGKQNNIGLTTVGNALATLTNPNAITFLRVNADNSVTPRTPAQVVTDLGISSNIILNRNFADTAAITGTIANTLIFSVLIPANTFQTNDWITTRLNAKTTGTGGAGFLVFLNTSAAIGGTQIGGWTAALNTASMFERNFMITATGASGSIKYAPFTGASPYTPQNVSWTSLTFNTTIDQYLVFTIQNNNVAGSSTTHGNLITITR
jgi:hypothetical protein